MYDSYASLISVVIHLVYVSAIILYVSMKVNSDAQNVVDCEPKSIWLSIWGLDECGRMLAAWCKQELSNYGRQWCLGG